MPDAAVNNAYVDAAGTLWDGTAVGFFWRHEATEDRFEQAAKELEAAKLVK